MAKQKKQKTSSPASPPVQPQLDEKRSKFGIIAICFMVYLACLLTAALMNFGTLFYMSARVYSFLSILQTIGAIACGAVLTGLAYRYFSCQGASKES